MKRSVIVARCILVLCIFGAMGMVNGMFEGSFWRSIIVILILAVIFLLFWKKADPLSSIDKKDTKII